MVEAVTSATDPRAAVEARGVWKTFGRTTVLEDVSLRLRPGEIHALVGQNGSGKSTLIKILSGIYAADRGTVWAGGSRLSAPATPAELRRHGIAFVHQDLGLVADLTVWENIRIGDLAAHPVTRRISRRAERAHAQRTLDDLQAGIRVDQRVAELRGGQRGLVAIARALQSLRGDGCIVFDESTQSLPRESIAEFNDTVRAIADGGTAILMVTHRLEEVTRLADRVTVLRDGRAVAEGIPVAGLTEAALSNLVLGGELGQAAATLTQREPQPAAGATVLKATGVSHRRLRMLDVELRRGEIVGVTGPSDAGHDDLPYVLAGAASGAHGDILVAGKSFRLDGHGIRELLAAGIGLVPQHRIEDGLASGLTALENLTIPRIDATGRLLLRRGWQLREFADAARRFGVRPPNPHAPIASYSGGNQQKILLAKWIGNSPAVLIAHEPTQAVDVGARADILRALRGAADGGIAVLISSIEAQDLALVCDRVLIMRDGVLATQLRSPMTAMQITEATYG
jgi:ribose transport system ATP-binding protein